jgi:hypothetical protein
VLRKIFPDSGFAGPHGADQKDSMEGGHAALNSPSQEACQPEYAAL